MVTQQRTACQGLFQAGVGRLEWLLCALTAYDHLGCCKNQTGDRITWLVLCRVLAASSAKKQTYRGLGQKNHPNLAI